MTSLAEDHSTICKTIYPALTETFIRNAEHDYHQAEKRIGGDVTLAMRNFRNNWKFMTLCVPFALSAKIPARLTRKLISDRLENWLINGTAELIASELKLVGYTPEKIAEFLDPKIMSQVYRNGLLALATYASGLGHPTFSEVLLAGEKYLASAPARG